jgi:hypothetical protein
VPGSRWPSGQATRYIRNSAPRGTGRGPPFPGMLTFPSSNGGVGNAGVSRRSTTHILPQSVPSQRLRNRALMLVWRGSDCPGGCLTIRLVVAQTCPATGVSKMSAEAFDGIAPCGLAVLFALIRAEVAMSLISSVAVSAGESLPMLPPFRQAGYVRIWPRWYFPGRALRQSEGPLSARPVDPPRAPRSGVPQLATKDR